MPLPVPGVERELTHTRSVRFEGYRRADGLWDIEGHLSDLKSRDCAMKTGVRRAGEPIHDMRLRVTIDRRMTIVAALACMDAVPYPGGCEAIAPAYEKLVGLNLRRNFRHEVKALFGGVHGCTHLTELLGQLPTAAIQTFAGEMPEEADDGRKPFQLDRCHALDTRSDTVRRWYPKWHRP